jgi:hypothetical protein
MRLFDRDDIPSVVAGAVVGETDIAPLCVLAAAEVQR